MMVSIYTLTLSLPRSATTPQIYPEGKLRCSAPVFEPGGGINVARAITHLGGKRQRHIPAGEPPGACALLADENGCNR
jgi:6-phosphofructokinase 2